MYPRHFLITGSVILAGIAGGVGLGGFATGGARASAEGESLAWSSSIAAENSAPTRPVIARDMDPKGYNCQGCGPTLAERRSQAYAADYAAGAAEGEETMPPDESPQSEPDMAAPATQIALPALPH